MQTSYKVSQSVADLLQSVAKCRSRLPCRTAGQPTDQDYWEAAETQGPQNAGLQIFWASKGTTKLKPNQNPVKTQLLPNCNQANPAPTQLQPNSHPTPTKLRPNPNQITVWWGVGRICGPVMISCGQHIPHARATPSFASQGTALRGWSWD